MALVDQLVHVPFTAGVKTKHDPRALEPPGLLLGQNLAFPELGGIHKCRPYSSFNSQIEGTNTEAGAYLGAATAIDGNDLDVTSLGVDAGDLLVFVGSWDADDVGAAPAGWTEIFDEVGSGEAGPDFHHRCYYTVATGPVTTVSWTFGGTECVAGVAGYRGVVFRSASHDPQSGSNWTLPAASGVVGGFVLNVVSGWAISASTITGFSADGSPATDATERFDFAHTSSADGMVFLADYAVAAGGTVGPAEWDLAFSGGSPGGRAAGISLVPSVGAAPDEIVNPRRLAVYNNELLLFTKSNLYSWSEGLDRWVDKGEYLAPEVQETPAFVRDAEQVATDQAELNGVIVYCWEDRGLTTTVRVAAVDVATGATVLPPTQVGNAAAQRPRVVACLNKVLLVWFDPADFGYYYAMSLDPKDLASTSSQVPTEVASFVLGQYDVALIDSDTGAVALAGSTDTTKVYTFELTEDAAVTDATSRAAQKTEGPIAVAVSPDVAQVFLAREESGVVYADRYTRANWASGGAAAETDIALSGGSQSPDQMTLAFRTVAEDDGEYRAYVVWNAQAEQVTGVEDGFELVYNWVDTGGAVNAATASLFLMDSGLGSHAFDYNGEVYVWLTYARSSTAVTGATQVQLQNSFFLYRLDGTLMGKALSLNAGGYRQQEGHLPGVQALSAARFAFCGVERRRVSLGSDGKGYQERSPRRVVLTFDSNDARRTRQIGETLFVTGAQVLQFDGEGLTELGFHLFPWLVFVNAEAAGSVEAGSYSYKSTFRSKNARGEVDRSTTAAIATHTTAGSKKFDVVLGYLHVTLKQGARADVAVEAWRTLKNPTFEAPFYLVSDPDPSYNDGPTDDNVYVENVPNANPQHNQGEFFDNYTGAVAGTKQAHPENGAVLETIAPPAATVMAADEDRLFLAGVAADPNLVWYSKRRNVGEVPGFNDVLIIKLPGYGGAITALEFLNERLVVFKERAVFVLPGQGIANDSTGTNYGPARLVSSDVGAQSADCVAVTPQGIVFFSDKGWHLLGRDTSVQYLGADIVDFDGASYSAVNLLDSEHELRCMAEGGDNPQLAMDTTVQNWTERPLVRGEHAVVWQGKYVYIDRDGTVQWEKVTPGGGHSLVVETAELKFAGLLGFQRLRRLYIMGEYRSAHRLKVDLWFNGKQGDPDQTVYRTPTGKSAGDPEAVEISPNRQKIRSVRVRITDEAPGGGTPAGESVRLTGMALKVGIKKGALPLAIGDR